MPNQILNNLLHLPVTFGGFRTVYNMGTGSIRGPGMR